MSRPAPAVVQGSGPLAGLELHVAPGGGARLVDDYQIGHPALAPFYAGHAYDEAAYRRKAAAVDARLDAAARERVAAAFEPTSARAAERLHRVLRGDGYMVTTGQQAGLFGGPLYTLYKALSAVRLAAELERRLAQPVVPVFWVAADDHDFAEVGHVTAIDEQNVLHTIALPHDAEAPPLPMAQQLLPPEVVAALDAFAATLPPGPFAAEAMARLRAHYRPGRSVAEAFQALMTDLLAPFDAVVVSSAHPALKRAAAPLLARELDAQSAHAALLARTTTALEGAGYAAQVPIAPDVSNVFHHGAGGRDRLVRADGSWVQRRSRERIADDALRALLRAHPEQFSPNVLLRPVVESALLPTLAYVAGPAELAYFAQIGCLFHAHGVEPPVVFPRHGLTLVDGKTRRMLDRHGLDVGAFDRSTADLLTHVVRATAPESVLTSLAALRRTIEERYAELAGLAAAIDPSLTRPLDGARRRALDGADAAERRILDRLRARDDVTQQQIRRAAAWLRPDGAAQQRRLNVFSYIGRYGPGVPTAVASALTVALDTPAPDWSGVRC